VSRASFPYGERSSPQPGAKLALVAAGRASLGDDQMNLGASRSRTVSVPCPPVSDRLPRRPREYEIDQLDVL